MNIKNTCYHLMIITAVLFTFSSLIAQDSSLTLYGTYGSGGEFRMKAGLAKEAGFRWNRASYDPTGSMVDVFAGVQNGINLSLTLSAKDLIKNNDIAGWRSQVKTAAETFGPGGTFWASRQQWAHMAVRYFEIWNEPNINEFLEPPTGMTRDECYYNVLKAAYEELKAVSPAIQVIAMNTAGGAHYSSITPTYISSDGNNWGHLAFIRDVNKRGATAYYDVIGVHPYTTCGNRCGFNPKIVQPPDIGGLVLGLNDIRADLKLYGKEDIPVWYTEVGYPIEYPNTEPITEEEQATDQIKLHALSAFLGVAHIEIMYCTDITYSGDGSTRRFGLWDGTRARPQTLALQYMISELPDPTQQFSEAIDIGSQKHAYKFLKNDSTEIIIYWTEVGSTQVELPAPGLKAEMVDMYGTDTTDLTIATGNVTVPINTTPRYVKVYGTGSGIVDHFYHTPAVVNGITVSPNPFTAGELVSISLPAGLNIGELVIYDTRGRIVKELAFSPASKSVTWHGTDMKNTIVGQGIYFCYSDAGVLFMVVRY